VTTPRGTTNIQTTFDLCTHALKLVVGYRNHGVPYAGFQQLKIVVFDLVDEVLHISLRKKKSSGVKSGDLAGQAITLLSRSIRTASCD
jgi:hypothetical protein